MAVISNLKDDLSENGGMGQNLREAEEIASNSDYPKDERAAYRQQARDIKKYQNEVRKLLAGIDNSKE